MPTPDDPVQIRPAMPADYDSVAALYRQFAPARHLDQLSFDNWLGHWRLAVEADQVLGYWHGKHDAQTWLSFVVDPTPPEDWTVSYLTVLVVDTTRRRGIGRQLLNDFMEQAAVAGNTWAVLSPESEADGQTQEELIRFYSSCGFIRLQHGLEHGAASSWMMGRALADDPDYVLRPLTEPLKSTDA